MDNSASGASELAVALKDREGNSIVHTYLSNNSTILSFDAICPSTKVEIGDDGTINQIGMDIETTISYGPRVMINLDNNASGIVYYEYSLGKMQPISNGFYRLTFVSPY